MERDASKRRRESFFTRVARKKTPGVLVLLLLLASTAGWAQTRSDFSGHWVLASAAPSRPGFDAFWLGTDAIVAQAGSTLTITRTAPGSERRATFQLGALESENVYTLDGVKHIKTSRTTIGATLLISTETTLPDGKRWLTHINRWALDADGTLVVTDTVICGNGECPSIVTTVKYKKV
jgi:hypothetical protein